ncbi:MAG: GxxExxY protein [bacterium]|nr:GxxExxY protein [bacterium]
MVQNERLNALTEKVIGAAIEVHRTLGPGFLESTYEEALSYELELRGIEHERQFPVEVSYKRKSVGQGRVDICVEKRLIVELKTVEALLPIHTAQVMAYLKATSIKFGLLINFNVPVLKQGLKRIAL